MNFRKVGDDYSVFENVSPASIMNLSTGDYIQGKPMKRYMKNVTLLLHFVDDTTYKSFSSSCFFFRFRIAATIA